jgi:enediyne biosynthesis protein E11
VAVIDEVLTDVGAESEDLDTIVAGLTDQQWLTPTPAPGWAIAHQIAHLASTDAMMVLAASDPAAFEAARATMGATYENFDEVIEVGVAEQLAGTPAEVLARWRTERAASHDALAAVPPGQKVPWLVAPVSAATMASIQFMELFAHGQDITDALGVVRGPTDRIRHLARFGVRTRDFAFLGHGLTPPAQQFRVELAAPSGEVWRFGPADASQQVSGPAADFCLLVTRRRHRDDLALVATGPDADAWLGIAQAYAGPPGPGRVRGQFSSAS